MMTSFYSGFALGFGLILAIGAQNAFVLRQGLMGAHVFWVCLTCALSDAILIAVGVYGLGELANSMPAVAAAMRYFGAAFLFLYGIRNFRAAFGSASSLDPANATRQPLGQTLLICLALTWLNPHVYLDTVLLLGSVAAQYPQRWIFGAGAITASFVFFFTLGFGARFLRPLFANPRAWRVLEFLIGCVMWGLAIKLWLG